ncbi:MAG: hypothetical protein WD875_11870 [Pirellulales bacterium]
MALDLIFLSIGSFLVAISVAYSWWASSRAVFLREEIFGIRDRLWDVARAENAFDDEAYRHARHHLNSLIRTAGLYSVRAIETATRLMPKEEHVPHPKSENEVLQRAIADAYLKSGRAVGRHVLLCHVTGWVKMGKLLLDAHRKSRRGAIHTIKSGRYSVREAKWLTSGGPEFLSDADRQTQECGSRSCAIPAGH